MKTLTPIKAIRSKCLECSAGQPKEVRECVIHDCALYPFRLGKNPNRKGKILPLSRPKLREFKVEIF